jgi:hypothetical protein
MQVTILHKRAGDNFKLRMTNAEPDTDGKAKFVGTGSLTIDINDTTVVYVEGVTRTVEGKSIRLECLKNDAVERTETFRVLDCQGAFPDTFAATLKTFEPVGDGSAPYPVGGNITLSDGTLKAVIDFVSARGRTPGFELRVRVTIAGVADATQYEIGFVRNIIEYAATAQYPGSDEVWLYLILPVLDAQFQRAPISFVSNFNATGVAEGRSQDSPHPVVWLDSPCDDNLQPNLEAFTTHCKFREWLLVRHKPSGCYRKLRHVDWTFDIKTTAINIVAARPSTSTATIDDAQSGILIGAQGDGSPNFVLSGPIANTALQKKCQP